MKVKTETSHELTPKSLAKTLADCEPSEFAEFWLEFSGACEPNKLDAFAKAMAPDLGGIRKKPLKELCKLTEYHEIRIARERERPNKK